MKHGVPGPARCRVDASGVTKTGARLVLVACSAAALATTTLTAQTVTLQASADTTLDQRSPNKSFGREATLTLKEGGSRAVIRFDPSAITAAVGAGSLASAELQVYVGTNVGNWGTTGRTVDLYRLATAWTEAGATWNCADDPSPGHSEAGCTSPWTGGTPAQGANGAGGDGEATDTAVITNATSGWVGFDVTSDVLALLAGTANHGWLLEKTDEGQAGQIDVASREGTAGLGPRLVLVSQSATSDTVPPTLAIASPSQPVLVNVPAPTIGLTYQDPGSGVDTSTLRVAIDGQDLTSGCSIGAQAASCQAPVLAAGAHTVTASVSDHAANVATATTTFQLLLGPGVSTLTLPVSADTFITAKSPDREHGRAAVLRVAKSGPSRALVGFDPGSLVAAVAGNQLLAAQLQLGVAANAKNWGPAGRTIGAYRLTTAWSEAAATWDCPADTNLDNAAPDCAAPWNGGSFAAVPTATALITRQTTGSVSFDVTADVAAFLAGAANDGWLIAKTDEALAGRIDFTSREASSGQPAQLIIIVQVPPGDRTAPAVTLAQPQDGTVTAASTITVTGTAAGASGPVTVTVNGQAVPLQRSVFTSQAGLVLGANLIEVEATDLYGNVGVASATVTLATTPPAITVMQPAPGALINAARVQVIGKASDEIGVKSVAVAGEAATLNEDGTFTAAVDLIPGSNTITVEALDLAGNESSQSVTVQSFSLPQIVITAPADLSYIASTTVTVSGTVSDPSAAVTVNGQTATVAGGSFSAPGVPLLEGGNVITATASTPDGHVNTATINVVRDLTAPTLSIAYPANGATVYASALVVSGLVNDIVAGTVNASQVTVTVNGQPAAVTNRSFVATVALQPGQNSLLVQAADVSGNTSQQTVTVQLQAARTPRVAAVSGGGQSAPIGTLLGAPLVAALLDATGNPIVNQRVFFRVVGNNGNLDGGQRGIAVTTNAAGHAAAHFTLGTRAGAGNQVVEAFAPGFAGPAAFQESAMPSDPVLIVVDSGDQQVAIPGQAAARPLVAVVTDSGFNRIQGTQVQFATSKGLGTFANGQQTTTVTTDSDGRAIVTFILDPTEGIANNGVRATIAGLSTSPVASFVLSGRAAGDPAATTVSGAVFDNANQPVPGVTVSVRGTLLNTQTDELGHFMLASAPPGTLTLIVDGSTANRPGSWPELEYYVTVIPGRDNTVNMPIYLLPLDQTHGAQVSETTGAVLTLPQVPGFALEIASGSVTFPGGARSGLVSVTVVHADKVPMVPNFGQQPRLIVTIQPAGARFNPPARLTLPNVEGLAPGEVTEMYSFDHDLGHFVSIGPATVSDDGSVVSGNPGVGVIKAGWHCSGNPAASGTPNDCPDCQKCDGGSTCVADPAQNGKPCAHQPNLVCKGNECVCPVPVNFRETSRSVSGDSLKFVYKWDSSTGNLNDLDRADCKIGEQVVYPTDPNNLSFPWPAPFSGSTPNPTVVLGPASAGVFTDTHEHLPIVHPYSTVTFTAQQRYIYTCACKPGANILAGIWVIVRTISTRQDGKFVYTITKNGLSASDNPLP